jgi:hypothetical protein
MDEITERILGTYDTITVVGASRHLGKEARGVPAMMRRHGGRDAAGADHRLAGGDEPVHAARWAHRPASARVARARPRRGGRPGRAAAQPRYIRARGMHWLDARRPAPGQLPAAAGWPARHAGLWRGRRYTRRRSGSSPLHPAASRRRSGSSPPRVLAGDGPAATQLARQAGALSSDAQVDPQLIVELLHPIAATAAERSFTYSRPWLRGLMTHLTAPRFAPAVRKLTPPAEYALVWRATLVAAGLFAQLGATVPTRGFHLAYSPGFRGALRNPAAADAPAAPSRQPYGARQPARTLAAGQVR